MKQEANREVLRDPRVRNANHLQVQGASHEVQREARYVEFLEVHGENLRVHGESLKVHDEDPKLREVHDEGQKVHEVHGEGQKVLDVGPRVHEVQGEGQKVHDVDLEHQNVGQELQSVSPEVQLEGMAAAESHAAEAKGTYTQLH